MKFFLINSIILVAMLNLSGSAPNRKRLIYQENNQPIENSSPSLFWFLNKMDSLQLGLIKRVNILHIGDSHIQADYMTSKIRQLLQLNYGNAGRGFIFPYQLAKTNGPANYISTSEVHWDSQRCVKYPHNLAIGISGMCIGTKYKTGSFEIKSTTDSAGLDFQQALVFYSSPMPIAIECSNTKKKQIHVPENNFDTLLVNLPETQPNFILKWKGNAGLNFYGAVLNNNNRGIVYSAIGVNGAKFSDYNLSEFFFQQLSYCNTDLIIVSLGTNESFDSNLPETILKNNINLFLKNLRQAAPAASLLLSLPSNNYIVKRKSLEQNKKLQIVYDAIKSVAEKNGIAIWDLQLAMGGNKALQQWKKNGLLAKDGVHFSKTGYELQGSLLAKALINLIEKRNKK